MRIAFAGTPEFARAALAALHAAGHEVLRVFTQPDRPAGRGLKLQPSAVKQFALEHGLPLAQPRSLRLDGKFPDEAAAAQALLRADAPECLVVAAYGLILPRWVLALPRHGCINIHGSLLPRWRGAAPIQRAIEAGDTQTGTTIMQMDEGLDTGAMLLAEALPIAADETSATLHDRLAAQGARLIVEALARLQRHLRAQDRQGRGPDRLAAAGRAAGAADPRLRSVPGLQHRGAGPAAQAVEGGGGARRAWRRAGHTPGRRPGPPAPAAGLRRRRAGAAGGAARRRPPHGRGRLAARPRRLSRRPPPASPGRPCA